jgi:hypothetical protein
MGKCSFAQQEHKLRQAKRLEKFAVSEQDMLLLYANNIQ